MEQYRTLATVIFSQVPLVECIAKFISANEEDVITLSSLASAPHQPPLKFYEWHENGKLRRETPYVKGEKHGVEHWWYENGKLRHETLYVEGKEHGTKHYWYKTSYAKGKEHGTKHYWYENGQLWYEDGDLIRKPLYMEGNEQD